tara:strand:+ start:588 stop:929 length:342 start_codon:yes stop_codon:yes gene_type:complete
MPSISNSETTTCNNGECVKTTERCTDGNCVESRVVVSSSNTGANMPAVDDTGSTDSADSADSVDSDDTGCDLRDLGFAIVFNGVDMTWIFFIIGLIMFIVFLIGIFQLNKKKK